MNSLKQLSLVFLIIFSFVSCTKDTNPQLEEKIEYAKIVNAGFDYLKIVENLVDDIINEKITFPKENIRVLTPVKNFPTHTKITFPEGYKDKYGNLVKGQLVLMMNGDLDKGQRYTIFQSFCYGGVELTDNIRYTGWDAWVDCADRNGNTSGGTCSGSVDDGMKVTNLTYEDLLTLYPTISTNEYFEMKFPNNNYFKWKFNFNESMTKNMDANGQMRLDLLGSGEISINGKPFEKYSITKPLEPIANCRWYGTGKYSFDSGVEVSISSKNCQPSFTIQDESGLSKTLIDLSDFHGFWK